jgi:hypothetical protein
MCLDFGHCTGVKFSSSPLSVTGFEACFLFPWIRRPVSRLCGRYNVSYYLSSGTLACSLA